LTVSRNGRRLAYTREFLDMDIYRIGLPIKRRQPAASRTGDRQTILSKVMLDPMNFERLLYGARASGSSFCTTGEPPIC
jgi:hypothetical protein